MLTSLSLPAVVHSADIGLQKHARPSEKSTRLYEVPIQGEALLCTASFQVQTVRGLPNDIRNVLVSR
jgi:hypothetical protein